MLTAPNLKDGSKVRMKDDDKDNSCSDVEHFGIGVFASCDDALNDFWETNNLLENNNNNFIDKDYHPLSDPILSSEYYVAQHSLDSNINITSTDLKLKEHLHKPQPTAAPNSKGYFKQYDLQPTPNSKEQLQKHSRPTPAPNLKELLHRPHPPPAPNLKKNLQKPRPPPAPNLKKNLQEPRTSPDPNLLSTILLVKNILNTDNYLSFNGVRLNFIDKYRSKFYLPCWGKRIGII